MHKVQIIEDDKKLRDMMKQAMEKAGFEVDAITDFRKIEERFSAWKPDLVLLDVNLPYHDGFYLCRMFRKESKVPIIFISARSEDMYQVMGIEMGADDYVTKPFHMEVLLAKINGAIRRCYGEYMGKPNNLEIGGFSLDEKSFKVTYGEVTEELSKNEFKLLKMFIEKRDTVISRAELLEELWDDSTFVDDNTLTVNVTRVKGKLIEMGCKDVIVTKRGVGYLLDSQKLKECGK